MALKYILYIVSCVTAAAGGIFVKEYDKRNVGIRNSTNAFNVLLCIICLAVYIATALIGGASLAFKPEITWFAILRGIGTVVGYIGYLEAVRYGSLLLTLVISRMGMLIPILVCLLIYNDPFSTAMAVGTVLLFAALVLFNGRGEGGTQKTSPKFWFYVMLSFAGNGVEQLAPKIQQKTLGEGVYTDELLIWSTIFSLVIFFVLFLIAPPRREGEERPAQATARVKNTLSLCTVGLAFLVGYGVLNAVTETLRIWTLELPPVFYYMASTGLGVLLSFCYSRFLYREHFTPLQYVGCVSAAVGLVLLNF